MLPRIPGFESLNTRLGAQPRLAIRQIFEPVHKGLGRLDDHHM